MQIQENSVVSFHYRLRDESGEEFESSHGREPDLYLHGHKAIVTGLEEVMTGKSSGDTFSVTLSPEQAYGMHIDGMEQRVPIKYLIGKHLHGRHQTGKPSTGKNRPKVGDVVSVQTKNGPRQAVVLKVGKFNVDLDTNHPLAGKTVTFDVEIVDVREATQEELDHGHAHGPDGHQH